MSYYRRRRRVLGDLSFNDLFSKASPVLNAASGAVAAASTILQDPALPEVTSLVLQLHAAQPTKGGSTEPGIGLRKFVRPLKFYVYSQQHTWVVPALVVGALAIPYILGRMSK